ncbi:MAG: hypothetical protein ONB07_09075 [candidate division KSB1 bacterium]|nr:hypothetical protein [candidate division KSB1 bacterium]
MATVWRIFVATAVVLATGGFVALRVKGGQAPVFQRVGMFLLLMAAGTAVFPSFLSTVGPMIWAGSYASFVVLITTVMTVSALLKARPLVD